MLLEKFCRINYDSYEDFYENFHINVPENFNFGFDVVDVLAAEKPEARALVWCNNKGETVRLRSPTSAACPTRLQICSAPTDSAKAISS